MSNFFSFFMFPILNDFCWQIAAKMLFYDKVIFLVFQIKASGVNFVELMCRQGLYPHCPRLPAVLGLEGAGVIIRTGKDVNHLKVRPARIHTRVHTYTHTHTHTHAHTQTNNLVTCTFTPEALQVLPPPM